MARRLGISRNSVRKYPSLLDNNTDQLGEALTDGALSWEKAFEMAALNECSD
jgi:hypothetical protein